MYSIKLQENLHILFYPQACHTFLVKCSAEKSFQFNYSKFLSTAAVESNSEPGAI